jgi:imidazole glycerol-phosphate synthase subunit HisF
MLKKRVIFTLLYHDGEFMLSRNFRLQKVGSLKWLQSNYNFSHISCSIDELVVLNVSRGQKKSEDFCAALKEISEGCFIPIAAGGGVRTIELARNLLRSGADKVVVNSALYEKKGFIQDLSSEFGQQCLVASMDVKYSSEGDFRVWSDCGRVCQPDSAAHWIEYVSEAAVGEIYLNSIDKDGTGQGYDFRLLDLLPSNLSKPIILAGGVGNASHLYSGLLEPRVDAVATAHLFNFVGDGLKQARQSIICNGINLPVWNSFPGRLLQTHD